jgi:hypothetical protein
VNVAEFRLQPPVPRSNRLAMKAFFCSSALLLTLLAAPASAQAVRQADLEDLSEAAREAEYHRLSGELHRYAERQTWTAVEQAYLGCVATGAQMKFSDHFHAAHAAQSRGDMKAARVRLKKALDLDPDPPRDLIDWLFAIDTTYSVARVQAYEGASIVPKKRPFDPVQSRAIDWANEQLQATGTFDGLLPRGVYTVDDTVVDLRPGQHGADVTVSEPGKKKKRKKGRKK